MAGFLNAIKVGWTVTTDAPVPQKVGDLDKREIVTVDDRIRPSG
jgi:hypothetical protein